MMNAPKNLRTAAILALVAILVGLNLTAYLRHQHQGSDADDRRSAVRFINSSLPKLMSYRPETIATYKETSLKLTGGPFKKELGDLLDVAFIADARKRQVSIRTTIQATSVTDEQGGKVTLLVYVNQWRTTSATKAPVLDSSRLKVSVTREGGGWLVTNLTAL